MMLQRLRRPYRAVAAAAIALSCAAAAYAGEDVVAKVGPRTITVAEVEQKLGTLPLFQLRMMGETPADIRRAFVDRLVALELPVLGARAEGLDARADVAERMTEILVRALEKQLRDQVVAEGVDDAEVETFYQKNRERYVSKTRIKISRIVVPTKELAEKLAAELGSKPERWGDLAKEHSIDRGTRMREGDVGFVEADGTTTHKGLQVTPALYAAAEKLGEGQVGGPLQDGASWVLLRNGGVRITPERTLAMEAPSIRGMLADQKVRDRQRALLDTLRSKHVVDFTPTGVDLLEVVEQGDVRPARRPGGLPVGHPAGARGPSRPGGPDGLR